MTNVTVEYVDVLTPGGVVTIDASGSWDNGYLDLNDDYSGSEMLASVERTIRANMSLTDHRGNLVLVRPSAVLALTYYEAPSRLLES